MRRVTTFALTVVAALCLAGTAFAGTPDGMGPWADYVVANNQGCAIIPPNTTTCTAVRADRSDPTAALGVAESPTGPNNPIPVGSFYSLGFSGLGRGTASITLGFDNPICNRPGNDLAIDIFEITREPYPPETVQVYVSADNVTYAFAGTVSKDGQVPMPASVAVANYVRLVDVSSPADFVAVTPDADGYDLDGVKALATNGCPGGDFGKVEICKSSANGMSGRTFQFSLNGAPPISVKGGRCTGAITALAGANRIVELPSSPPTDVTAISVRPSSRQVFLNDLPSRTIVVYVAPGSTAANETMVTFTNAPAGGTTGELKLCKLTSAPIYLGRSFSFRVNGGPLVSTPANDAFADPGTWTCRILGTYQSGSVVTVSEVIPTGAEVDYIDTDPGANLVDFDTTAGTAQVRVTGPVTTVLFDNEPIPPAQFGYIEVCKDAFGADPFVTGEFFFTVSPPDGNSFDVSTLPGQCTASLQVAAGIVRVTEHPRANITLVDAYPEPTDRFVDLNVINGTLDVEVPVSSSPNDETQVHFVNSRNRSQLKVCKDLGPSSAALAGQTFTFTVVSPGLATATPSVQAPGCVAVGNYPVGNTVTVTENLDHGSGQPGEYITTTGEGTFTIVPGTNEIHVANTALGVLQVCKAKIAYFDVRGGATQPTFRFRIDGGAMFLVQAGSCTKKIVAPGQHTVTELAENDYALVSVDVQPPGNLVGTADIPNRSVTVNVPFAGNGGGETAVTFNNAVRTGQFKICKAAAVGSTDAFKTLGFTYTAYVQNDIGGFNYTSSLMGPINSTEPTNCTLFTSPFPILNQNGTKKVIGIVENGSGQAASWNVIDISVTGSRGLCSDTTLSCVPGGKDLTAGIIDFYLGPDLNVVTYTNQAK
jgi:hypothetical protein